MKQIQKQFQLLQLKWIYIGGDEVSSKIEFPRHTIWIDRSDRLNALKVLGELGYRLRPGVLKSEEFGAVLDHAADSISRIHLVWNLKWLSLDLIEGKLWERSVVRYFAQWDVSLAVLNLTDRWIAHLASLMHQDEKTMDEWVHACSVITGQSKLEWQQLLSLLTLESPGPMLAKVIQIAAFWKVSFPVSVLEQARVIEKEGKLARELRRTLESKSVQ